MRLKIVTKLDWPSFRNVAALIGKALKAHCNCTIHDRAKVKPGGNILFIGTVFHRSLNFLSKFLRQGRVVFYGTTEGHSFVDEASLEVARQIKIVAVSNFVKQMLEESGIPVAGVVPHGLDMNNQRINVQFYKTLKERFEDKSIIFAVSANHARKGLDKLLHAYRSVEQRVQNSFLILHSEPVGYCNLPKIAMNLKIKRLWITNLYGELSPTQLSAIYKLCRIYIQPSYAEGFGLPILEAFRFDKPVIAVDAPPFNEVISQKENGILILSSGIRWFNFKNKVLFRMHMYKTKDLAHAIVNLLLNQQLIANMQIKIQEKKKEWDAHKLYPKLLNYFS